MRIFVNKIVLFFCISLILAPSCLARVVDRIVVVVNDQSITQTEIEHVMRPQAEQLSRLYTGEELESKLVLLRKEVIQRMIEDKLILQEAKKQNIEPSEEEIEERLKEAMSKFQDKEAFEKAIRAQGLNIWELKKIYKEQIMVRKIVRLYVRSKMQITPTQISEYYSKHPDDFKIPQSREVSQILIKYQPGEDESLTQRTVAQVEELLTMGADFAVIAKKYSQGANAPDGGNMGLVQKGAMAKEIDEVIFSLNEGQISKPIRTNIGFVILKIGAIHEENIQPQEEVKDKIEDLLFEENTKEIVGNWIEKLKSGAFISIKE